MDDGKNEIATVPIEWHIPDNLECQYATNLVGTFPRTRQMLLSGPLAPGWVLRQPLAVTAEQDEGYWLVSDDQSLVYGDGPTVDAALDDYILSLIDYYQLLEKGAQENPKDRVPFRHIQRYLRPSHLARPS